ncbi:MAG: hypothetical protein N3G77_07690 [Nitrososphaeria archaeon]|nr:hypothetical protein [Nitrososphaeria archaeon]
MAPRINWEEDLREKLDEILERLKLYNLDDNRDELESLKLYSIPEGVDDRIIEDLILKLNLKIKTFIMDKFEPFHHKRREFNRYCEGTINYHLSGLNNLLHELHFKRGQNKEAFSKIYEEGLNDLLQKIQKEATGIYNSYRESYDNLVNNIVALSSELRGYLSIANFFERMKGFWNKKFRRAWTKFNNIKIGDDSIQSIFCKLIPRYTDLFNRDYSSLEILEFHKYFEVEDQYLHEIYDNYYYRDEINGKRDWLDKFIGRVCSSDCFQNKGRAISTFLEKFLNCLRSILERKLSEDEFRDLYNHFLVQNAITEYELFRALVYSGYPTVPKICIYERLENEDVKIGEVDVAFLDGENLHLVEVTFRRDLSEKEERMFKIKKLLEDEPEGISGFESHIINNRKDFEDFINEFTGVRLYNSTPDT